MANRVAARGGKDHRQLQRIRALLVAVLGIVLFSPLLLFSAQPKVVAIGDVHGDFDDFSALLEKTGLVDQDRNWTGGNTRLVQVGDLVDRGPKPRKVMDLVMALQSEAHKAGGEVIPLLGNHEIMNIMGDLRYVTPENFASFADEKSEQRRQSAWQEFTKWRSKHEELVAAIPALSVTEEQWMTEHPAGFVEQREAYSPEGKYGKWLRSHSAVAKVEGVVFVHGGLDPVVAAVGIDAINTHVRDELSTFDSTRKYLEEHDLILPFFTLHEMTAVVKAEVQLEVKNGVKESKQLRTAIAPFMSFRGWFTMASNGPFWFRGYAQWSDEDGTAQITKVLQSCDAKAVVVGHTPQLGTAADRVAQFRPRFDNRVFMIDTGMLSSYFPAGRASALEFNGNGEIAAQYQDSRVVLVPAPTPAKGAGTSSNDTVSHQQ
jgi:hypothetical protein